MYRLFSILAVLASVVDYIDSCSIGLEDTYIDDVSLLKSSTQKVLIESNNGDCVIWKVGTGNEESVNCDDYSSNKLTDWSTGDDEETGTTVNEIHHPNNLTYTSIDMSRNGETFAINLSSSDYSLNPINYTQHRYWMYLILNQFNTTFIIFGDDDWEGNNSIAIAIEFESEDSNSS